MSAPKIRPVPPAIALPPAEAAAALGLGETAFREHVAPHVRCIRRGRLRLYPVDDLKRWVDDQATHTINP